MPNKPRPGLVAVSLRLGPEVIRRIEYRLAALRTEHPGIRYTRTSVLDELLGTLPEPPEGWEPGAPVKAPRPTVKKARR